MMLSPEDTFTQYIGLDLRIEFGETIQKLSANICITKRWLTEMLKVYSYFKLAGG